MIVPQYWAEGRVQHRKGGKQITVRRFGWSDESEKAAQQMADARAQEALGRALTGSKLSRSEPKVPYNGADGVPIREQIVERRGETVITRNSYGALCLNTPDVLFIDIDHEDTKVFPHLGTMIFLILMGMGVWLRFSEAYSKIIPVFFFISALFLPGIIAGTARRTYLRAKGGAEKISMTRVSAWLAKHPDWNFRAYRTPAGLRLIATQRKFSPSDPAVSECFEALGSDTTYRRMCLRQNCFRARVSPKPWRIGLEKHLRPRPGVWPVKPEHLPAREKWIREYEATSSAFASCSLSGTHGCGSIHAEIQPVVQWHDELCRAESGLPIA